jgi:hypothetical protein
VRKEEGEDGGGEMKGEKNGNYLVSLDLFHHTRLDQVHQFEGKRNVSLRSREGVRCCWSVNGESKHEGLNQCTI